MESSQRQDKWRKYRGPRWLFWSGITAISIAIWAKEGFSSGLMFIGFIAAAIGFVAVCGDKKGLSNPKDQG